MVLNKTFVFYWLALCFHLNYCHGLGNSPSTHFSLISVPSEVQEEESSTSSTQPWPIQITPTIKTRSGFRGKPEIRENQADGSTQVRFVGIMDKLSPEPIPGSRGIQISPRGKTGVVQTETTNNNILDAPITWAEAYSQSVKKAYVKQKVVGVDGNRDNVVRFQPIVPPNAEEEDKDTSSPPPHEQVAKMARFIVHSSNWTSMATISSRTPIVGFPFANVFSLSDGPFNGNSSGIPYMYMTPLDISVKDLKKNSKCSLTMSLAQGDYCRSQSFDPEDPRCAHVILTGIVVQIKNSTTEAAFAREALFSRHPDMSTWPQDHGWFFAKLEISHILVLDYFGGAKSVTPEDYFAV